MLTRMLDDTMSTMMPPGMRLRDIPRVKCIHEMEFKFRTGVLDASSLNRFLREGGYEQPDMSFRSIGRMMQGFIDLVFEHDGRFFVLDWKSNHLGDTPAHYGQPALAAAMRDQGYHLQYLLYLVALDRYLRRRVAGYDPERHLGGAVYLFVRGVRPGWRDADGAPTGVFFHRPSAATLARLSALFDERGGLA